MLPAEGYVVRVIDRFFFGRNLLAAHDRLEVVVEDCRKLALEHFAGMDAVIDLAAISNDPSGELFQEATRQINCDSRVHAARMAKKASADSVAEICEALEARTVDKTTRTIILEWYKELTRWHRIVGEIEMYGGIVET